MSSRLIAKVHLPGVRKKDLKVEIHATHLTISAKHDSEAEVVKEAVYHRGYYDGSFFRSVLLPVGTSAEDVQAEFANEVLEIRALESKTPDPKPRRFRPEKHDRRARAPRESRSSMVEIRGILCPVDFSSHSRHALDQAVGLAAWYGASVTVLHVHPLLVPMSLVHPLVGSEMIPAGAQSEADRARTARTLTEFVSNDRAAAKIETVLEESLDPASAITARATRLRVNLITLGTNGRSGSRKPDLGSVAAKVLTSSLCPVLSVPARAADAPPLGPVGFRRIICPVDFSHCSARALDLAAGLARDANALLTIVHVVELISEVAALAPDFDAYREARLEPARKALRQAISPALRQSCTMEELLQMGAPHHEILRLADEQAAGLIVMGVRGDGESDYSLGSAVRGVVSEARCPVLTVP